MASVSPHAPLRAVARGRSKLRVGIFADSLRQPRWLVESLARIATSDFAEIAVLAASDVQSDEPSALWKTYGRIDRWLFGGKDPLKPMPVELLVPRERRLAFAPADPAWRARIADLRLDVAVTLGAFDDKTVGDLARFGAWRYSFGESHAATPHLAAVRELIDESPVVSSAIHIRRGSASRLACRSYSRTISFSLARSQDRLFPKAGEFLERSLRRVHEEGDGWLDRQQAFDGDAAGNASLGVGESLRGMAALGARVARRTLETCFTVGQWSLAFRFAPLEPWNGSLDGFHRLVPPPDRFWADPFPIEVGGRHFIFFEELPFSTEKGHISVVEVDRDGRASAPTRVLEHDHHLSYPFLVEKDGNLYMIPESAASGTVEIYRCETFPGRWRRERVLLDGGYYADSTVHHAGDRWWMFTNLGSEQAGADDELHLFSASDLLGDWKPHRANPVKSDARCSRPAGHLFEQGGTLYRPSQICTPLYGSGIVLNRVTRLDDEEFSEEEERRIVPCAPLLGVHTINRAGDLSVTDVFARRRRF